ncbi:hypothetical protein ACFQU1_25880 [Chelatococcus sp. GCM10030263]|uniref:hypothetical protein n=1 Tax=Chelatococcus sp. GCM10030263 TaxID=3273387 RepID=UPI0036117B06
MDEKTIEFRRRMNDAKAPDRVKIELEHARDLGLSLSPEHLVYSARPRQATTKIESDLRSTQIDVENWGGVDLDYRVADKTFLAGLGVEGRPRRGRHDDDRRHS